MEEETWNMVESGDPDHGEKPLPLSSSSYVPDMPLFHSQIGGDQRNILEQGPKKRVISTTSKIKTKSLDDGYSWRKYGQKDILGSRYPRSYFRCSLLVAQGCKAGKQVQRNDQDPDLFDVTYQRPHTCDVKLQLAPISASSEQETQQFLLRHQQSDHQNNFDGQDSSSISMSVVTGERSAEKLSGLPLAVKLIGGVLRYESVEDAWNSLLDSFLREFIDSHNLISSALNLSYSHMTIEQRSCFHAFSSFGKGYEFQKDEVIKLWIKMGLITPLAHETADEIGNKHFDELRRRSLIEFLYSDSEETGIFMMHNDIYDFCLKMDSRDKLRSGKQWSGETDMIVLGEQQEIKLPQSPQQLFQSEDVRFNLTFQKSHAHPTKLEGEKTDHVLRRCQFQGGGSCSKIVYGGSQFCVAHERGTKCAYLGCSKVAHGRTLYCLSHGGGKQCARLGCNKFAHGDTLYCLSHGGGKRCAHLGCNKSARGDTLYCLSHGGDRRCAFTGCVKSAVGSSGLCKGHKGTKRCDYPRCAKLARGGTNFCWRHKKGSNDIKLGKSTLSTATHENTTKSFCDSTEDISCKDAQHLHNIANPQPKVNLQVTGSVEEDNPIIYGREDDKERMIQMLLSDDCMEHNISTFCIVAAGGIGKTTFANLVYTDPIISEIIEILCWVRMSTINNVEGLLKAIIESLTSISCDLYELTELQEIVEQELMGRRFLLVLDNLLECDDIFVSDLLSPLSVGAKGSILLVTTRHSMMADEMWRMQSYDLNRLSEEHCWMIVQEGAFGGGRDYTCYPRISEIGMTLVPKCEGKPLAAKVLGGLLRFKINEEPENYNDILSNDLWEPDKNQCEIIPALRVSYSFLSKSLQKCFLYCSLFPKGHMFVKDHLIHLWMSQGFFESEDGKDEEDIGIEYFDELLSRAFFQDPLVYNTKKQYHEMHDLVYDLAQTMQRDEVLWLTGSRICSKSENVQHKSFIPCKSNYTINFEAIKECRDLQSILLINKPSLNWSTSKVRIVDPKVLEDLFLNLVCIRTLNLSCTNIKELPDSIQNLKSLRFLGLNNTNIRKLPDSICNLSILQILELEDCAYLHELPKTTKNFVNLQHLYTRKKSGYVGMPNGIGQLTKLRTLSAFSVGNTECHSGISELKNLTNLRGDLRIGGLKYVVNKNEAEEASLQKKEGLKSLTLQWSSNGRQSESDVMQGSMGEVFENLEPHTNLEELIVKDYSGSKLPGWIGNHLFSNLISITLDNCDRCQALPTLGQLISLRYLFIRKMDSVQRVGCDFCGLDNVLLNPFPSLEILKIWEMYNWEEWCGVEDGDFLRLRSLSINKCFKLKSIPSFLSLIELSLNCCSELPSIPELSSLKSLSIEYFISKILMLPIKLSALQKLEVKYCNPLLSLVGLNQLASLKELKLVKCPVLNLAPDEQLPLTLQVVNIHNSCSMLNTWCPPGFHEEAQGSQRRLIREKQPAI